MDCAGGDPIACFGGPAHDAPLRQTSHGSVDDIARIIDPEKVDPFRHGLSSVTKSDAVGNQTRARYCTTGDPTRSTCGIGSV
jgi:hypothetical protein